MVNFNYSRKLGQINLNRLFLSLQYKKSQIYRLRFILISIFSFLICFLFTIHNKNQENNIYSKYPSISTSISLSNIPQPSSHLILLWTDLFKNFYWHQPTYFNSSKMISCTSKYQCQFTRDQTKLLQASIVAFHLYDINRYQLPERITTKNINQNWIFITGESPINFYYQNPSFIPYILDNYFDQSISYKSNSLFPIFSSKLKFENLTSERQFNINSLKIKTKPILWIVSNCITFSQREKYIEELKKFIPIDIYGKCGKLCLNETNSQCKINFHEYYFYLSFENTRCKSYITEKFWNIISDNTHRLVPIVMGADENDYQRIAPKQSYIHVNQYKTPEDLAKYLNYLMKNPEKYLLYLQWREYTEIEHINNGGGWMNLLCSLCQMAYEYPITSLNRINFTSWFHPNTECHYDDVQMLKKCKQATLAGWMSWIHNMKCP